MRLPTPLLHAFASLAALGFAAGPAAAQQPVAGAPGWLLFDHLQGVEGRSCMARTNGPEADTMLIFNNDNVPVLIAGRPDWDHGGEAEVTLSIDGEAPVTLHGGMALNLVLTLVAEAPLLQRLRVAHTLDWTFPFGRFRANVAGLGIALDAVRACRDGAPATST